MDVVQPQRQFRIPGASDDDRRLAGIESKLDKVLEMVNNLVTKQSVAEQRIGALEQAPGQQRSAWTFGLSGCNTLIMAATACIGAAGFLTGIAGLIIALVK